VNISQRSYSKELLDSTDIPFEDIERNMEELEFINKHLGGHKITLSGIRSLLRSSGYKAGVELAICEVGCGGGDNMLAILNWCKAREIPVRLTGIDINSDCVEVARGKFSNGDAQFITADYITVTFDECKPDYIFSSLFCHHFTNEQLVQMIRWMRSGAKRGFFINDLQRHSLAYYSIKLLTAAFSRSYLVKNDAPLSVLRGFTRKEWELLLDQAGIDEYLIKWKWAFRYLVLVQNVFNEPTQMRE
jgi:ubiquinone/menaquinone biosynthesis C-methylase UbiE